LRKIRKQCKQKCLKSYYKLGWQANLCNKCKCYLKLCYQFEKIDSEWDLFSGGRLKQGKISIFESIDSLSKIDIKEKIKYNLIQYILFYDLNISYQNLLIYVETMSYDLDNYIAFLLTQLEDHSLMLTVHY